MVVCDTQALIWATLTPDHLSRAAREAIDAGTANGRLACSDITLWETAMLIAKGRIRVDTEAGRFISAMVTARRVRILPICPEIAALSQSGPFNHGDPADRLIAATALHHRAPLVTSDRALRQVPRLQAIW